MSNEMPSEVIKDLTDYPRRDREGLSPDCTLHPMLVIAIAAEGREHPGNSYNWTQMLSKEQNKLKKKFGKKRAYADPDIDTPWIEEGDIVDGKPYKGPPIW